MLALAIEFTRGNRVARALCQESVRLTSCVGGWKRRFGGHSGGETPGPIPNPEVKPSSADGTALETGWESRSPPDIFEEGPHFGALLRLSGKVRLCRGRGTIALVDGGRARSATTGHLANGLRVGSSRRSERPLEPERPTG